uniref:Putative ovule protein n=1 Tax=Solanum chacoense TaxID=4108 RepID=A0A0V0H207_SOLCH
MFSPAIFFWLSQLLFLLDGCVDYMVAILEVKDLEILKVDVQYAISIPCWSFWFLHCNLYPLGIFGSCTAI